MITFMRPSGNPITVNDTPENRALAEANGWVDVNAVKQNLAELKTDKPKKRQAK